MVGFQFPQISGSPAELEIFMQVLAPCGAQVDKRTKIPISVESRDAVLAQVKTHEELLGQYKTEIIGAIETAENGIMAGWALSPIYQDTTTAKQTIATL